MSLDSAKSFVGKMQGDEGFAKAFWACGDNEAKKHFLANDGYSFGIGELMQAMQEMNVKWCGVVVGGQAGPGQCCCGCTNESSDGNVDYKAAIDTADQLNSIQGGSCCGCTHENIDNYSPTEG